MCEFDLLNSVSRFNEKTDTIWRGIIPLNMYRSGNQLKEINAQESTKEADCFNDPICRNKYMRMGTKSKINKATLLIMTYAIGARAKT